ncbi:MAG: type I secretion system permease/ATPase [Desulfobacterium sp.]|jgi:PrtD family type I secretion system ABC transporter|nr:type I secretion system permease/ATPase [Desulfobacterium sp.]
MNRFIDDWKKHFTFAALLSCFVNILQLTFPFYMFAVYGNVVVSNSMNSLVTFTVAAVFALIVLGFFNYVRSRILATAGNDLNSRFRNRVFTGMLNSNAGIQKQAPLQILNDLGTVRNFFTNPGISALFDAPWAPLYLALIFLFHPVLGLIATTGCLIMVGLSILQEFLVRESMKTANIKNAKNQRFIDSFLRNAEVVNGMGMIHAISDRWASGNREVIMNQTISSQHAGLIQSIIKPMQNLLQVTIYFFGAYYALTQGFDVGLMVAGSIIMGRAIAPLMQIMGTWKFTIQAREAYKRLDAFVAFLDENQEQMPLPTPKGHIFVDQASLRIGERFLLNGVTFELNAGDFMGIIGPNGAGKSTLCRMLLGLWPAMIGKVYLDGTDVFVWDQEQVGSHIGYLPQDVELFSTSIAENIARLGPVDMDMVERAAELCGIHTLVASLPEGYNTMLDTQEGIQLSGGQKQRLGLARALYGDPCLLVLDEPTSNLDEQGEKELLETLSQIKQKKSCTCIMVTHKPGLLQSMDKILVLQDGRIALFGPRDQVFAKFAGAKQPQPTTAPTGANRSI